MNVPYFAVSLQQKPKKKTKERSFEKERNTHSVSVSVLSQALLSLTVLFHSNNASSDYKQSSTIIFSYTLSSLFFRILVLEI